MGPKSVESDVPHTVEFARCFLRLANLPNCVLDRLSRYEATLWRQLRQTLVALDALDRRKPQERGRRFGKGRDCWHLTAMSLDHQAFSLRVRAQKSLRDEHIIMIGSTPARAGLNVEYRRGG